MSNNPNNIRNTSYANWLEQALKDILTFPVKGICIAAMTTNGECYVNYHNVPMIDKLAISGLIQQDAMLDTMADNGFIEYEEDEDEDEGEEVNGEEESE